MTPILARGRPEYPKTLKDFIKLFPDDAACWRYLVSCRWPHGFIWQRYTWLSSPARDAGRSALSAGRSRPAKPSPIIGT
jgi:hypothetical protein